MMLQTFIFSRNLWGLPSKQVISNNSDGVSMRSTYRQASVYVSDRVSERAAAETAGAPQWKSSIKILCSPTMHAAYSRYVERSLCYGAYTYVHHSGIMHMLY
jgi:hypothetical protein